MEWRDQHFDVAKAPLIITVLLACLQKFGFIKRVDKGWITTVKDLESWRFER